ncbi:MAG: ABC transporter ATP-binding protein [Kiloniellaceae bacterium]
MNERPIIEIDRVTRKFGSFTALDEVSVQIREGEFFSLLGPSGCGKTTLLRQIAGFDDPTSGAIRIDGQAMVGVPANRRPTNMVFQNYAIFPHLTVAQNVAYGLRRLHLGKAERERRVQEALAQVDMAHLGARRSNEISGGQRQRVALARALIMRPKVLLLDEPLSALDKKLREQMQVELRHLQRQVGITFILVTHDQEEALTMSDRIAVMFGGKIIQCDSPEEIYQRPRSRVVAEFIGGMNFLDASILSESDGLIEVDVAGFGRAEVKKPADTTFNGSGLTIGARPERMTLVYGEDASFNRVVSGTVVEASYYGDMTYYSIAIDAVDRPIVVSMRNTIGRRSLAAGEKVQVGWGPESLVPLT